MKITRRNFFKRIAGLAIFAPLIPAALAKLSVLTAPKSSFGQISPQAGSYAAKRLLEQAHPGMLDRFSQLRSLPMANGKTIKFRRYESLSPATGPLSEGYAPTGSRLTYKEYSRSIEIPRSLIEGEGG